MNERFDPEIFATLYDQLSAAFNCYEYVQIPQVLPFIDKFLHRGSACLCLDCKQLSAGDRKISDQQNLKEKLYESCEAASEVGAGGFRRNNASSLSLSLSLYLSAAFCYA